MAKKTFAILTSGGDAPGMNAAIRAATRTALKNGCRMLGSMRGFRGLVEDDCIELTRDSVANIIHRGGSIIKSSRCDEFMTVEGRARALANCKKHRVDGLILVGGDGTMKGALAFMNEGGPPAVGLPGTIDNDIVGTDYTIGFDTAVNTALQAIDKVRDTAETMDRMFFIETMGRRSGAIALAAGMAGGCNVAICPEKQTDMNAVAAKLVADRDAGATSLLVVIAEGDDSGGAYELARQIKEKTNMESRVVVLGHTQRGGNPTAQDRILATVLGVTSVEDLLAGRSGHLLGWRADAVTRIPFAEARTAETSLPPEIVRHVDMLLT
jgi:6-phosphofructokinase 1